MFGNLDDVIQWQQTVTIDLGEDVLAFRAQGQQAHQVDVKRKCGVLVETLPRRLHQRAQLLVRLEVVEEDQYIVPAVDKLQQHNNNQQ